MPVSCDGPARPGCAVTAVSGDDATFAALSDVVLSIAGELSLEQVLDRLVHAARDVAGARYAALGTPEADGDGFSRFLHVGMDDATIAALGPLPRRHGLLGAMLGDRVPYRSADIRADPRFEWWPAAHPRMGAFLGVPIVSKGDVIGAFYLADKEAGGGFTAADQARVELLAAHAAIAIENARLYELARELSVIEERNRLARELHDSMSQALFSLVLVADTAADLVARDPEAATANLRTVKELAHQVMAELRTLVFELRPAALEVDGLVTTLRKHAEVLGRVHRTPVTVTAGMFPADLDADREREVFRILQEALHNALQHAEAARVDVAVAVEAAGLVATVTDDGRGFDQDAVGLRARRLGLTSMRERAERALGGTLTIITTPGAGTTVRLEVPAAGEGVPKGRGGRGSA